MLSQTKKTMNKENFYKNVREELEEYISANSFNMAGDEYDDVVYPDLSNLEYETNIRVRITGYNSHDNGDGRFTPPTDSGCIFAKVEEIFVFDMEGDVILHEKNVDELSINYEY